MEVNIANKRLKLCIQQQQPQVLKSLIKNNSHLQLHYMLRLKLWHKKRSWEENCRFKGT